MTPTGKEELAESEDDLKRTQGDQGDSPNPVGSTRHRGQYRIGDVRRRHHRPNPQPSRGSDESGFPLSTRLTLGDVAAQVLIGQGRGLAVETSGNLLTELVACDHRCHGRKVVASRDLVPGFGIGQDSKSVSEAQPIEDLAARSAAGDRQSLEHLIRATQADVWRFIAHLTDPWIAEDLTQETYLRALRTIHRFEGRSSFRTWLFTIARRVVTDEIRRSYRRPRTVFQDVEVASGGFESVVELGMVLNQIDADRRVALVLTQVVGMSYTEAAQVCGVPVGTIRSRVARGRQDLVELSSEGPEPSHHA